MTGKLNLKFFYELESKGKKSIIEWCMNKGLLASRYECPKCRRDMKLVERNDVGDGYVWVCRLKGSGAHHVKRAVRKGSWFEDSSLSICDILRFVYLWVFEASKALIMNELNVWSPTTVIEWRKLCQDVCVDMFETEKVKLGGPGTIVEMDERGFGKRLCNRKSRVNGQWVIGAVERGTDKCFFSVVETRSSKVLQGIIEKFILPGTTIVSDCWRVYDCLSLDSFAHLMVNNSLTFEDPEIGTYTNTIEGLWSLIKRDLPAKHHDRYTGTNLFDSYLAEFLWRRKYHNDHSGLFAAFLICLKKMYSPQTQDKEVEPE